MLSALNELLVELRQSDATFSAYLELVGGSSLLAGLRTLRRAKGEP